MQHPPPTFTKKGEDGERVWYGRVVFPQPRKKGGDANKEEPEQLHRSMTYKTHHDGIQKVIKASGLISNKVGDVVL